MVASKISKLDASCKRKITVKVKHMVQTYNLDQTTMRMIINELVDSGIPNVSEARKYIRSVVRKQIES